MLKIVTDLDDVLINYASDLARRYNLLYGTNIQPGELSPFPDIWEKVIGKENVPKAWAITRAPDYNLSLDPIIGAKEGLEELKRLGATIYVVTHRPPEYQQSTEESIANHFPGLIAEVHCVGLLGGKG
jgi:FMN phosphatase YigB (HAD superfamily)